VWPTLTSYSTLNCKKYNIYRIHGNGENLLKYYYIDMKGAAGFIMDGEKNVCIKDLYGFWIKKMQLH
jgi:hypothetical protein